MKVLLAASAALELGAGAALACCPSVVVTLLLGSPLDTPAAIALGRIAGAALLALGVACSLARNDAQSCAGRGLVSAMIVYNVGAVVVLGSAGIRSLSGVALWPAVFVHAAMAVWCVMGLRKNGLSQAS